MEITLQLNSQHFGYLTVLLQLEASGAEASLPVLSPWGREGFERATHPSSLFHKEDT